jgi:hypothetical protein
VKAVLLALKVPLVVLAATLAEAGTVRLLLSEASTTVVAAAGAAVRVTVHVKEADGPMELDPQEMPLTVGGTLTPTVPPPPVIEMEVPSELAPSVPLTPMS